MILKKFNGLSTKIFKAVEKGGNALPHPAVLFALFAVATLLISWLGSALGWSGAHPSTGETVKVINLVSKEELHRILLEMVDSYTGFAPLGVVMVSLLGIGIAESSGLMKTSVMILINRAPKSMITFIIVFAGILSNTASDMGYILIIPMAGVIFHSLGRHPIAGMSAAFAGVSGGFSANLFIGTLDPLLAGLSTEAAGIIEPGYYVMPTANYYFMAVSSIVIALAGTWVNNSFIEPRLGKYTGDVETEAIGVLESKEKKAMKWTMVTALFWVVIVLWGLIPNDGFLRGPNNSVLHSPVIKGFIAMLFLMAGSMGIVYGRITGKFKNSTDVINGMNNSFVGLVSFLVLVFFAAQFVAWFKWSNLGMILAISGANWLQSVNLGLIPLMVLFIIFYGIINLFMGSASAKWAIIAPVTVPMFMLLGYSPELSQAVFRIGDSVTNVISPMMSYFALLIVYYQKYDKNTGIGTIISTMMPYSFVFFIAWTILLVIWVFFNIPLGPDASIFFTR